MPGNMSLLNSHSLFGRDLNHKIYFFLLCVLAAAMPTSRFVMSLAQILMGANWLLEGNYIEKIKRFKKSKAALLFISIYLLHIVGLLWSTDIHYGLGSDLKNKLPMLTLTFLVFSSRPLTLHQARILLFIFFASLLTTTFIGFYIYATGSYLNFRHISPYVSHIYLSMMLVFSIFTLPWMTSKITSNKRLITSAWIIALWLAIFLFILRSMTGILCLGGVLVFLLIRQICFIKKTSAKAIAFSGIILLGITFMSIPAYMLRKVSQTHEPAKESLMEKTPDGNSYKHFPGENLRENGHYVYYFIAEEEAREAWAIRSEMDFDGKDLLGNELKMTLYRYLSSMGQPKNKHTIMNLGAEDISAIERGTPNKNYLTWPGILVRIHQSVWELYWYTKTGNPSGHTFSQRIELWKASWIAFMEKPVLGWGTGDIYIAVNYGLNKMDSQLENYHMKPHNQYLLFLLTLGVVGSLFIYLAYAGFVFVTKAFVFLPFNIFLIIMLVSMFGNNPIDAQTGQTFFTFITLFFAVIYRPE